MDRGTLSFERRHKNDNCYAEQKNYDAVRKVVGYFRFDTPEECATLEEVYREESKAELVSRRALQNPVELNPA